MKNVKLRIVSLCLAIALFSFGAYTDRVYGNGPGGPDNPIPGPQSPSPSGTNPNHCAGCYLLWLMGF